MLWWLAQNALAAAVLAIIVAAVCRLGRFSPPVRHALWLVVLIKLLTPPIVAWPWSPAELWETPDPTPIVAVSAAAPPRRAEARIDTPAEAPNRQEPVKAVPEASPVAQAADGDPMAELGEFPLMAAHDASTIPPVAAPKPALLETAAVDWQDMLLT